VFNYIQVDFPETTANPAQVYSASLIQNRYEHEIAVLKFRDWGTQYDAVQDNSPVHITFYGSPGKSREFYGYVHHINVSRSPGKFFTEVVAISSSYTMKQQSQEVYKNITADQVVKQLAEKHGLVSYTVPHPRIYPQIAQAAHTDWELCVRLAKQCGYTLRTQNTEIYFQPMLQDFTTYRSQAQRFVMRHEGDPNGSTIYSFYPMIGQALPYEDAFKSAVAVNGVDQNTVSNMSITQQIRNRKTRAKSKPEVFDRFATTVVATDPQVASYEAQAAEDRNSFPYRAVVEVLGEPDLRPDMPVYLEGLGSDYSGYWTILSAEHKILQTEKAAQTYTTVLTVGSDSLGDSIAWVDGQTITAPDYSPKRTIIPNVKQTNIVPKTALMSTYNSPSPSSKAPFSLTQNRQAPKVNNRAASASFWKSQTASLNNLTVNTDTTPASVKERVRKAAGLVF
jgi:phage protein D